MNFEKDDDLELGSEIVYFPRLRLKKIVAMTQPSPVMIKGSDMRKFGYVLQQQASVFNQELGKYENGWMDLEVIDGLVEDDNG